MTNRDSSLLALLALAACTGDTATPDPTAATQYWAQPDTVVYGLGRPADIKAQSRDRVWIADVMSQAIFSVSVPDSSYRSIGVGDREPVEVRIPAKLAVDPSLGLATYDGESERVELLTLEGEAIRGFDVEFFPGVMSFSRNPIGLTFAIAEGDSLERKPLVVRTNLQGGDRDTLLSATHGPEALRGASARFGEMFMSPSRGGMWVLARTAPDTLFDLAPAETRRLVLRPEDRNAQGVLADGALEMVWLVQADSTGYSYAAYDARLASAEPAAADSGSAYLGRRTTPVNFRPWTVHDGIAIGVRVVTGGAISLTAYDLHADRFARPE